MEPSARWRTKGFQLIIERLFPHVNVTLGAFHSVRMDNQPINRDFVAYGFLSSLRWAGRSPRESLSTTSKFRVLQSSVLDNRFVGPTQRADILEKFSLAQRVYTALCRRARTWKVARAREAEIDTDLYMRPLSSLPSSALMRLYHDDCRTTYLYRISDLLQVIRSALSSAPDFFVSPQPIRNPYTNQEFTEAQLYTIYQRVKESAFEIPAVFHLYRAAGMQVRPLVDRAEALIREDALDAAVHMPSDRKHRYITQMLRQYDRDTEGLEIHPQFPPENLIAAFGPFLPTYLRITHSLHPDLRRRSERLLKSALRRFVELNPLYGRLRSSVPGPFIPVRINDVTEDRPSPAHALARLRRIRLARLLRRARVVNPTIDEVVPLEHENEIVEAQEDDDDEEDFSSADDDDDDEESDSDDEPQVATSILEEHTLAPIPTSEITTWLEHEERGNVYREAHSEESSGEIQPLLQEMPDQPSEHGLALESQPPNSPDSALPPARV